MAWRIEFYLLVYDENNILLIRKILFSSLEDKFHIFAPPCDIQDAEPSRKQTIILEKHEWIIIFF